PSIVLLRCLCSIWPPLRSTLFPYTTLFRSPARAHARQRRGRRHRHHQALQARVARGEAREVQRDGVPAVRDPPAPHRARQRRVRDRKSTRLNSSHVKISYAVFCLKKKTDIS